MSEYPTAIISTRLFRDGFSFLRYAHEIAKVSDVCPPRIPNPLRHIFSLARIHQCEFVVEETFPLIEINGCVQEVATLERIRPEVAPLSRRALRITFFKFEKGQKGLVHGYSTNRDTALKKFAVDKKEFIQNASLYHCIGYLYIYIDSFNNRSLPSYVPEAVIEPLPLDHYGPYIHSKATFPLLVLNKPFDVTGSFFAQQEGATWCCAHAATQVVLKNIFRSRGQDSPLTYEAMNEILQIDNEYIFGGEGLAIEDIVELLTNDKVKIGASVFDTEHRNMTPDEIIATAYYAVESGLPAILTFSGGVGYHAMAVVGHTFDPSLWSVRGRGAYFGRTTGNYSPSHAYVDKLIVQDDNFGPYWTVPRSELQTKNPRVIVPQLPHSVLSVPDMPEILAGYVLRRHNFPDGVFLKGLANSDAAPKKGENFWFDTIRRHITYGAIVTRTIAVSDEEYISFLTTTHVEDGSDTVIGTENTVLLERIKTKKPSRATRTWMVEISVPELYQWNTRRLGEFLVHELPSDEDPPYEIWLIRLPGVLSLPAGDRYKHMKIPGRYHYPIATKSPSSLNELWK